MKHLFTFFLLLGCVSAFSQNTYSVCNIPTFDADFTNLQTAINTVPNGSILIVQGSGISYGAITVNKPIILRGTGYNLSQNAQTQANYGTSSDIGGIIFDNGSNGSEISGFSINGNINVDSVNNLTIKSNKVVGISANFMNNSIIAGNLTQGQSYYYYYCGASIYLVNCYNIFINNNIILDGIGGTGQSCTVVNNTFCNRVVPYYGNSTTMTMPTSSNVYNNIFLESPECYFGFSGVNLNNNLFINCGSGGYGGTYGNIDNVPSAGLFIGYPTQGAYSDDGRYQLAPGSPAIGAGVGGIDCGAFGGSTPYKLSGIAAIPNI